MRLSRRTAMLPSLLAALAAAPAALFAWPQEVPLDEPRPNVEEPFQEVFFAVLEGLYRDGVPTAVVDALLVENDAGGLALFVPGCGICLPVQNALRVYRARPEIAGYKQPFDTFGVGLSESLVAACTGDDLAQRFDALGALVERWVAARLERRRLTPDEHAAFAREMQILRKKGMEGLAEQTLRGATLRFKSCSSCDAANAASGG